MLAKNKRKKEEKRKKKKRRKKERYQKFIETLTAILVTQGSSICIVGYWPKIEATSPPSINSMTIYIMSENGNKLED
jgi:hypothetical protein